MEKENTYMSLPLLLNIRKIVVLMAVMLTLTSCMRAQSPDKENRQEAKNNETTVGADPLSVFHSCGLPDDAYPAAYLGQDTIPYGQLEASRKQAYLQQSCLANGVHDFGTFYFFVQPIADSEDETCDFYNIWMYDKSARKLSKIFSHHIGAYTEMQVDEVHWNYDIQTEDEPYITLTGVKGAIHKKKASPVVVIAGRTVPYTPHPGFLTVIINPVTNRHTVLKEKFVGFMGMDDKSLPAAEQEFARRMVLTTTVKLSHEDLPAPEDADFAVRNFIHPSLHAYSTDGVRLGSMELPHEEIDVVR